MLPLIMRIPSTASALLLLVTLSSCNQRPSKIAAPPQIAAPVQSVKLACQQAGGKIWSGVQIYLDSACTTPSSTVRGGGSGKVLLLFSTGELEWKQRSAVAQAFVKSADPAIAAQSWVEIQPPN